MSFTVTGIIFVSILMMAAPIFLAGANLLIDGFHYCDVQIISGIFLMIGSGATIILILYTIIHSDISIIDHHEKVQTAEEQCMSEYSCLPR